MITPTVVTNPLHRGHHETLEPFLCRDTRRGACTSPGRGFASCGPNRHRRCRHYPAHCPQRPCWYCGIRKPDRNLVGTFVEQCGRVWICGLCRLHRMYICTVDVYLVILP